MTDELRFTKEHEWIKVQGEQAVMGISDFAQKEMGDVTFVELPQTGKTVKQNDELAVVESVKAASDVYAPLPGTVSDVNTKLEDAPDLINKDPYGEGWICRLKNVDASGLAELMTSEQYASYTSK